ncbi:membrane component of an ABC superfamily outer membrane-specific lipoprotein transporter [Wigglesworthia glossinidia endosymbiont of Glossina morsitans morsitans (Yale colony)]|uniref:Membrane component of an ABC superfamily outer membrane-specific lipoprotein transporter n=1 Tax=Wigglesworthia glossinidia endosymbiont of Glossina morsitans morsitans (Yale colony) TaxID=1142511 RepID=H6Q5R1_WIGGL|nr:FtsX-like permease family protein [Wigglesworthia glossinidia]AFA40966.1 membrane component of an ABC superfamily outer membrane-specific lipoprotein transporter [Wigglesworthia glossinidia endosymbiont of Glossina morsitans morsitans (Yale colony)]
MYQPAFLYIGIRYILKNAFNQYNKLSSWISLVGITIGIFTLILVTSIMNGFEKNLAQHILKYIPHAILKNENNINFNKNLVLSNNKECSNIRNFSSFISTNVIIQSEYGLINGTISNIESIEKNLSLLNINNKVINRLIPGQYKIIIGYELSKILNVHINDRIRLIFPEKSNFTIVGLIPTQRIFTVFDIFYTNSEMDKNQLFIHSKELKKVMRYPEKHIDGWRLWLQDPLKINTNSIKSCFISHYSYQDWRDYKSEIFRALKMEKNVTLVFLSLIAIISICNVCIALSVEITYKKQEIAIFKTQGCKKYEIFLIFILYGIINGVLGIFFGNITGIICAYYLNNILSALDIFNKIFLPVKIQAINIIYIDLIFIIFVILSTLYPSYYAMKIQPAKTLKYE